MAPGAAAGSGRARGACRTSAIPESSTPSLAYAGVRSRSIPCCVIRSVSLLALAAAAVARADEVQTQPTIQVTASRVPETVDSTLADVSVITRADIDASGSRDVLDLLRLQAGVDLYRTGGPASRLRCSCAAQTRTTCSC